jgi:hypothetical protein
MLTERATLPEARGHSTLPGRFADPAFLPFLAVRDLLSPAVLLRHQFGMPDFDRTSLKIRSDLVEILRKLRQRSPDLVIGVVRKPSRTIGLRSVVACFVHVDTNEAHTAAGAISTIC